MTKDNTSLQTHTHQAKTASTGTTTATGPAQIIEIDRANNGRYPTHSEICGADEISSGDIVVTPDVYPHMVEHLQSCAGLIIYAEQEVTGRGPIVARELEVPAVIDFPEIISEIQHSEQVTVDAEEGLVIQYQT